MGARLENPPSPIARQLAASPAWILAGWIEHALDVAVQRPQNADARHHGRSVTSSMFANGTGNFITVAAGASNHYVQSGNLCNGAAISDGGTGTAKTWATCP